MKPANTALLLTALFLASLTPVGFAVLDDQSASQTSARSNACSSTVCINEVLPNPNGFDDAAWPGGEWLEVHNAGTTAVDMLNWTAVNSGNRILAFDANTIVGYQASNASTWWIAPGDYMVLARNGNANFYLTNSGMTLSLFDETGTSIHEATWGSVTSGVSYEQDQNNLTANWIPTSSPSPGQATGSGTGTSTVPSDLMMTEVMANPWHTEDNATWPGGEWVEIQNSGNTTIDLTGWTVVDAAGNVLEFDADHLIGYNDSASSMNIAPGAHRVLAVNGTSNYGILNNGGEALKLIWPNGSIASTVQWSSTVQGMSLMDDHQSNNLWGLSPYPTPGELNPDRLVLQPRMTNDVRFSELLPNGTMEGQAFPDGEWIELFNNGSSDVDLNGWSILDGLGNVTYLDPGSVVFNQTQGSTTITAGERRLVQFTGDTELWDNHNHLFLRTPTEAVVDTATYVTDYGENRSLLRSTNPTDPWTPSTWNTPGQPEPGTVPSSRTVRFSELMPDGVGADNQAWPLGEWLELENHGNTTVDLAGWRLQAASRMLTIHEHNMPFQSTTMLPAGEVVLIALNGTSAFYLKHTAPDAIGLLDPDGAVVDTAGWSATIEGETLVAPNSTHAGVGPNASMAQGDWRQAAWPTPGTSNPVWPAHQGPNHVVITEVLPYCNDDSITPHEDWVEVHNTGEAPVNLSRWSVQNNEGDRRFIRDGSLWNANSTLLEVGERAVFTMEEWILTGLGDRVHLLHPDGGLVDQASWTVVTDCQTLVREDNGTSWVHALWPTPGEAEPEPGTLAGPEDLRFTRLMPVSSTSVSSNLEFLELHNTGDLQAMLNGWKLRAVTGVDSAYEATITSLNIPAGQSVVLTNDVSGLGVYESGGVVDISSALNRSFYLSNSGAAIQLLDPSGQVVDTVVYGNGPTDVDGWSGIALVEPLQGLGNLIYLRGDGCGDAPDSDTVADWHQRWSRLGGSSFCLPTTSTTTGTVVPLIGPDDGLADLLAWIEGANTSLSVHMYHLHDVHLVEALIAADNRGVEVTVVMDAGDTWWSEQAMDAQRGMAVALLNGGVNTLWFGDSGENPYAYVHSKVAVRDNDSVWIGSGNWKSSSHPVPGDAGNRDWGVLIHDAPFTNMVANHLAFDEDPLRTHITPVQTSDAPLGWTMPSAGPVIGTSAESITGPFEAKLLVCPDACIGDLVSLLNEADEEILLSLQYLDLDWSYGWGDNPIVAALEGAAERDVRLRLVINGAYLDEDIQRAVDTFNEEWNFTRGYDTAAVVMSPGDNVTKLHNKGAIVDGEHVLVSSINWGDSALIRNREMGVVLSSMAVASVYHDSWMDDWNRLDDTTDSDQDGLFDRWEVRYDLNRSLRSVTASGISDESGLDPDGDGLNNAAEQLHGGHPHMADTDGDCIPDGLEVAWASATALDPSITDVDPTSALNLADANGNGIEDATEWGCDLGGAPVPVDNSNNTTTNVDSNGTNQPSLDDDDDGVLNAIDECPDTAPGEDTDIQGCSATQQQQAIQDEGESANSALGENLFLFLMIGALVLALGAYMTLRGMTESDEHKAIVDLVSSSEMGKDNIAGEHTSPVLDATGPHITPEMMSKVPGWTEAMVREYMLQGWTMAQLVEYYNEEVTLHQQQEQH